MARCVKGAVLGPEGQSVTLCDPTCLLALPQFLWAKANL